MLSDDGLTVTFYYDDQMWERDGYGFHNSTMMENAWCSATTAVFNPSFSYYRPTSTAGWFFKCSYLTTIYGMENLNTENVTDMSGMFWGCSSLKSLDVSHFDTGNVTDMSFMFSGCSGLTSLDVSHFDTGNVTNMDNMFAVCSSLTSLDVSHFDTRNVTNMVGMFIICSGLTSLDVSHFNTWNVKYMGGMFYGCSGLTSLDVTKFNTRNGTSMGGMFYGCSSLTSLDLSKFNTRNVTDMDEMFCDCSSLTSLDVSNFDTGNVTNMKEMFRGCSGLTSLDVSNFNTANVTDMCQMFEGCSSLENIFCNDTWSDTWSIDMFYMFYGCSKLQGYDDYNNYNGATYAKPIADGGYFTSINEVDDAYWWTYYTDEHNTKFDANTTVYTATLNADNKSVVLNEVWDRLVPSGQAVILKTVKDKPLIYLSTEEDGWGNFSANDLKGTTEEKATDGTVYTLAAEGGNLGFYRYTGETLAARKAYLVIEGGSGARYIGFAGSEATAITDVAAESAAENTVYDLQGRRVSEPQKGLYIVNGKKIVKR